MKFGRNKEAQDNKVLENDDWNKEMTWGWTKHGRERQTQNNEPLEPQDYEEDYKSEIDACKIETNTRQESA